MSNIILSLGPVMLRSFEVPDRINIGGKQRLAVHQLTDGTRIIDSFGRDDADISFRGVFSGPSATRRARLLDVLRVAGQPMPLTWDVFSYTVILSEFEAAYERQAWIPYHITCKVLRDEASSITPATDSLASSLLADINAATLDSSTTQLDLTSLRDSFAAPGATTRDTGAFDAVQSGLAGVQSTISAQIITNEMNLRTTATQPDTSTQAALDCLTAASLSAQQLAILVRTRAYVGRAGINLNNAST